EAIVSELGEQVTKIIAARPENAAEVRDVNVVKEWVKSKINARTNLSEEEKQVHAKAIDSIISISNVHKLAEVIQGPESDDYKISYLQSYLQDDLKRSTAERIEEREQFSALTDLI